VERDFTKKKVRWAERIMEGLLFAAAAVAVAIVLGIVYVVVSESAKFFAKVSVVEFLTSTTRTPHFDNPQ
jgi:phosphate transport system permease protein